MKVSGKKKYIFLVLYVDDIFHVANDTDLFVFYLILALMFIFSPFLFFIFNGN